MPPGGHAEDGGKGELGCRRDRVRPNLVNTSLDHMRKNLVWKYLI
jgi:hypothetical protein